MATTLGHASSIRHLNEDAKAPQITPTKATAVAPPTIPPLLVPHGATDVAPVAQPDHTTARQPTLTFFMHDIIGGSNPSAIAPIITDPFNDPIPLSKSGGTIPPDAGIHIPNTNPKPSATDNNPNTGFLFEAGHDDTTTQTNGIPCDSVMGHPLLTATGSLQHGTIMVIDDKLTIGHEFGSLVVGKAQGFFVSASEDGSSLMIILTALMEEGGEYGGSISFFGVYNIKEHVSQVAVVGGTSKYHGAKGYATIQFLPPTEDHAMDGVLQFNAYLT
ncbi:dirigent protein 9 [Amborella trichopoda]|nr:dirigent protein 9 [Amborella trichopoda]|eukprot:XP_006850695.2 dirigent protein 9 [Amborella trichopoda]